jgi:hypothetical protein
LDTYDITNQDESTVSASDIPTLGHMQIGTSPAVYVSF